MRFDVTDDAFREEAVRWLAGLGDETLSDLEAVFAISPGYYPTTLYELWQAEVARRGLPARMPARVKPLMNSAPVSHPQECDWRFTPEAAHDLLKRVTEGLPRGACIAHLGTPSTFRVGYRNFPTHRHLLLERNATMTSALANAANGVITVDLGRDELPATEADAAILDPPWYPNDTWAFLTAACSLTREGGLIWLCQPTLATRPGVSEERASLDKLLPQLGLARLEISPRVVRYQTPHFEAMSLRAAAGELTVPPTWRIGDLFVLRKDHSVSYVVPPITDERWAEERFGPVRIKLRATDAPEDLASVVPGDRLNTVSRRDPVRPRIGFWTSGNRVFGLLDPSSVGKLITLCDGDLGFMQFSLARTLNHAKRLGVSVSTAQRLFDVLLVELQEHQASEGT